jgi:hypothetical protein
MIAAINDPRIQRILALPEDVNPEWRKDLQRFEAGDVTLTRQSAGESTIKSVQRLLIFLGYSTGSTGSFTIDGDFGRGTNRAVAQFQLENGLNPNIKRQTLCYDCTWQTASKNIVAIPDVRLTVPAVEKMLATALRMIDAKQVMCGNFEEALFHLNGLHRSSMLTCKQILPRYGAHVDRAVMRVRGEKGVDIQREWILSIIRQETGGIVRPRFEQHYLTKFNQQEPQSDFAELRYRSMSFGLGQIMGENYKRVGAPSARAMFVSPIEDQVLFVARFLAQKSNVVTKKNPGDADFRELAKFYNGAGYETHHYHESIATWFKEFRTIL